MTSIKTKSNFSFLISSKLSKAGLINVLILYSWFAFLKKSIATLLVSSFLSKAIILPSSDNAKAIDNVLNPVNVPISKTIDLQMDWIVSKKKYDFIGKRSLYRSDTIREDRKQLVGLLTDNPNEILEEGAQIVSELGQKPVEMIGHVTSSYFSPNLNKSIALAVVKGGKKMKGQKLFVPMENKNINVTVSDFIFLDKENKRINA